MSAPPPFTEARFKVLGASGVLFGFCLRLAPQIGPISVCFLVCLCLFIKGCLTGVFCDERVVCLSLSSSFQFSEQRLFVEVPFRVFLVFPPPLILLACSRLGTFESLCFLPTFLISNIFFPPPFSFFSDPFLQFFPTLLLATSSSPPVIYVSS